MTMYNNVFAIPEQCIDDTARFALAVTIYHHDLALVQDCRRLTLAKGGNLIAWRHVASRLQPATTHLSALAGAPPISLLEQQLHGARMTPPDGPAEDRDPPTLSLFLVSEVSGRGDFELAYLTAGLQWRVDYVVNLAADGASMDLSGWITLTNRSGLAYRQARVHLVAGTGHPLDPPVPSLAEVPDHHHLYQLSRPVDLLPDHSKQVALLSAPQVPVQRELLVRGGPADDPSPSHDGWRPIPVATTLYFANEGAPLGVPLPKGVMRVYAKDRRGQTQFIGADTIAHTPVDEIVTLELGECLTVTARRQQTAFHSPSGTGRRPHDGDVAYALEVTNAGTDPVIVTVQEDIPGDWTMLLESLPHSKVAANLAAWEVQVPAEGTQTLTWRVQIRH